MKLYKELTLTLNGSQKTISFGIPESEEELDQMFSLRYDIYSKKGYIDENKYPNKRERDTFDDSGLCTYFMARVENRTVGTIRLIQGNPLPTETYYDFEEPEVMTAVPKEKRLELGRLIVAPYNPEENIYFPRGVIMLFLLISIVEFAEENGFVGGYAFIKEKLKVKLLKRKFPVHIIKEYKQCIPENDTLYKYFTQATDPVLPIYFLTHEYKQFLEKALDHMWFNKVDEKKYILKNSLVDKFSSKPRLTHEFWKKYFNVYDTLNELIPYQELLSSIITHLNVKKDDKILDAGSGTGNLSVRLERLGAIVSGIDSSKEGIEVHKSKGNNGPLVVGDLLDRLPFNDGSFDKVASNNVLYAVSRKKRDFIFSELYRVLKPGGTIVVSNIKEGFKPLNIYKTHIKTSIKTLGVVKTIVNIFRLIVPTIKIFYYNILIQREHKTGDYDFFQPGEQKQSLIDAGFIGVSDDIYNYAGYAILNYAKKTE